MICDFGFWPETIEQWHSEGLPDWVIYPDYDSTQTDVWFGMDRYTGGRSANIGLLPGFEAKIVEDLGDQVIEQQSDGVRVRRHKTMSSIPIHEGHLLVDRESWEKYYLPRLQPNPKERYPAEISELVRETTDPGRERTHVLWSGSLYGCLRDWMGVENLSMLVYDEPDLFEEMVETLCVLTVETLRPLLEAGARYDAAHMWEDMCYSGGPLISPQHFKQYLVPRYRRIADLLRGHGIDIIWNDCDGKIDALIPLWMDAGINTMFPIEVGTWLADPIVMRREYGKDLLLMGGMDKHILQRSKEEISAEVKRLAPLVEEGGYIPMPDHRVPPDVPYENYLYYLKEARAIWGHGVNLKPMGEAVAA
jgi:uroporphyrinogen decarboxylase